MDYQEDISDIILKIRNWKPLTWFRVFRIPLLLIVVTSVVVCSVRAQSQQKSSPEQVQGEAVKTLHRYLQLRFGDADWKEVSKFITWPDEPRWDCKWVVAKYELGVMRTVSVNKVVVPVVSKRLGLFCYEFEFRSDLVLEPIEYELVRFSDGWKVNAPIPDYPDISADVLVGYLKDLVNNLSETPEHRAKAEETARQVADALKRANSTPQ